MSNEITQPDQGEVLNLQDLLVDEQSDGLSDYLSISMESVGNDTVVSVSTVEDCPTIYSSTINGVSLTDMHYLIDSTVVFVDE